MCACSEDPVLLNEGRVPHLTGIFQEEPAGRTIFLLDRPVIMQTSDGQVWEDFVAGPVTGRGLSCNDDNDATDGIARLLYRPGASATEDDRRAVREWARRRGEIAGYDIGPLANLS